MPQVDYLKSLSKELDRLAKYMNVSWANRKIEILAEIEKLVPNFYIFHASLDKHVNCFFIKLFYKPEALSQKIDGYATLYVNITTDLRGSNPVVKSLFFDTSSFSSLTQAAKEILENASLSNKYNNLIALTSSAYEETLEEFIYRSYDHFVATTLAQQKLEKSEYIAKKYDELMPLMKEEVKKAIDIFTVKNVERTNQSFKLPLNKERDRVEALNRLNNLALTHQLNRQLKVKDKKETFLKL